MFAMLFAFGIPVSLVFADEIPYYMDGEIIRYDYRLPNGSPDWDTFYRVLNQCASQRYRSYTIEITDVYGNLRGLSRYDTTRFTFINRMGAMITMHFLNETKRERIEILRRLGFGGEELVEAEREFTNYAEALKFWRDAVEMLR
jgi:hypothetical protein